MSSIDTDAIRNAARWLRSQSVSTNADPSAPVTKRDLEKLRDNIAKALESLAEFAE